MHGRGRFEFRNGEIYEGEWRNDMLWVNNNEKSEVDLQLHK
jgi:hypothetical protein